MLEFLNVFDRQTQGATAAENEHVAAIKEELRPFIEAARTKLPGLKAAWAERNALFNEINSQKFLNGLPSSANFYINNLSRTSDPVAMVKAIIERWQNISYDQINDGSGLNRWEVDPNRRSVLISDILVSLRAANCESAILENVAAIREKIAEEAERITREAPAPAPFEVSAIHKEKPQTVVVETRHNPLR
jgi:hypothetical protein